MISSCLVKQAGALSVGTIALAELTPPDLYPVWEKGGMIAVLCSILVALWISSRNDQSKNERRRTDRENEVRKWRDDDVAHREKKEARDQERHGEMVSALSGLKQSISENALRCDARRTAIEGLVVSAATAQKRKKAKRAPAH